MASSAIEQMLLCRVDRGLAALPRAAVIEAMRPLPVTPLAGVPDPVAGIAIIRGGAVPVVDARRVLGAAAQPPGRFVTLRVGPRTVALAVDAVLGLRELAPAQLAAASPLLRDASAGVVDAIGALDGELLVVLDGARLISDAAFDQIDREVDRRRDAAPPGRGAR